MTNSDTQNVYTMGRSEGETQRLIKQSQLYDAITRNFFARAGISSGMKVLDIGSGAGDVAMIAAEMVGPEGQVVGLDVNADILKTARSRAEAAGLQNVNFIAGDVRDADLDSDFDALVGRLVLMYIPDVGKAFQNLLSLLNTGGIVAFQEIDATPYLATKHPDTPVINNLIDWMLEVFRRTGGNTYMGLDLYRLYEEAGLPDPDMHYEAPIGCSESWAGFTYVEQSFRSLLPLLINLQIATAEEVGIDSLADRVKKEIHALKRPFFLPPHVTACTIKSGGPN